jgi:hypothetical protein
VIRKQPLSHTFVIRLWQEGEGAAWRISLKEAGAERHELFADLESLAAFLTRVMRSSHSLDLPPAPIKPEDDDLAE